MPGGSDYRGPSDALQRYAAVVEEAGEVVKGAKNPYTSRNGHMSVSSMSTEQWQSVCRMY